MIVQPPPIEVYPEGILTQWEKLVQKKRNQQSSGLRNDPNWAVIYFWPLSDVQSTAGQTLQLATCSDYPSKHISHLIREIGSSHVVRVGHLKRTTPGDCILLDDSIRMQDW
jgi:hypothetical protein